MNWDSRPRPRGRQLKIRRSIRLRYWAFQSIPLSEVLKMSSKVVKRHLVRQCDNVHRRVIPTQIHKDKKKHQSLITKTITDR